MLMQLHLENAKTGVSQRIQQGRATPIDKLARDILLWDTLPLEQDPPYQMFSNMPLSAIKDIKEEILEFKVSSSTYQDELSHMCSCVKQGTLSYSNYCHTYFSKFCCMSDKISLRLRKLRFIESLSDTSMVARAGLHPKCVDTL